MFFIVALLFNLLIDIRVIKTNAPLKFEKVFFIIALCFLIFESGLLITNIVTSSIAYSEEYKQQTTARYLNFEDSSISFYNSGESYQLEVVFPEQTRRDKLIYTSSNEKIATVDENGLVTAQSAGTCTVYAALEKNPEVRVTCKINVVSPSITFIN